MPRWPLNRAVSGLVLTPISRALPLPYDGAIFKMLALVLALESDYWAITFKFTPGLSTPPTFTTTAWTPAGVFSGMVKLI